ncbi:MAG: ABC transporter permease [Deltaproteobacteria bacterium]|nr:ABC transporter permease [Deltaproteobacteria bacterium]MBW2065296.1 ABC transporter permease [Deltaproteobacteria bacterium]
MRRFFIRRLLILIPTFLGITLVVFATMKLIPGDPIIALLQDNYTEELAAELRSKLGLDRPLPIQYAIWLRDLVSGDWGTSIISKEPVRDEILRRLPVTIELLTLALFFALLISIPIGIISAKRRNTLIDYSAMSFAMLGISLPEFFLGALFLLFFALGLQWFPATGYVPFFEDPVNNLRHLVLPALTLGMTRAALIARLVRNSMLEVIRQDYIDTARAKGLSEFVVINKHALKNALIPTVTVVGLQIGYLIGGAIIVESLFAIPGIGSFGIDGILQRDYPMVQAFTVVAASGFIISNLVVDIVYTFLDPRIRA